jgi:hypothetical protein
LLSLIHVLLVYWTGTRCMGAVIYDLRSSSIAMISVFGCSTRAVLTAKSDGCYAPTYTMLESVPKNVTIGVRLLATALAMFALPAAADRGKTHRIDTVYIIPSSHWDLGFLRPPDQQMDAIKPHLDAVLAACEHDADFRWTIESVWQLNAWLERTQDPTLIARMAARLKNGQIELSAADGSMHTEFLGSEELNRLVYAARKAGARFGIRPQVAMMNDTPGFSSRVTQVLARSDVPYMITGSNTALGGGMSLGHGKMPFYWQGPDGSKVLLWQTQSKNGGYTEGLADYYLAPSVEDPYEHTRFSPKEWRGLSDLEITQRGVKKLLSEYTSAGYQHSLIAVMFMHDGIGPEYEVNGLLPNVHAWNAAGMKPRLVVATASEFFAAMVKREGAASFPTYSGDWNGLWSLVKTNSPAMSSAALALQNRLPEAETLQSLLRMSGKEAGTQPNLSNAYRELFVYDEHNGAGGGGWPKVMTREQILQQNEQYAVKLKDATSAADREIKAGLLSLASFKSPQEAEQVVLVFNPSSWIASRVSCIKGIDGDHTLRDRASADPVPMQRMRDGSLCFEAKDVPALGYRTYALASETESYSPIVKQGCVLESPYYRVEIDVNGNITRITDKRRERVLMDALDENEFGRLMLKPASMQPKETDSAILTYEAGPVLDRITVDRPGSLWPRTVITLPQTEPRILLSETLDRSRLPFVPYKSEALELSFGFRFGLKDSQLLLEDGNGVAAFPETTLPGARKDAVVPRHAITWSNRESYLALTQKDSFFDTIQWSDSHVSGVDVVVMLKSDQTETKDQGIQTLETSEPHFGSERTFSFALQSGHGTADPVEIYRDSVSDDANEVMRLPKLATSTKSSDSLLSLKGEGVVVLDAKPSEDGAANHYALRLQEIAGKRHSIALSLPVKVTDIAETTLTEDRVLKKGLSASEIDIKPHQTLTLRLTVSPDTASEKGGAQ